MSTMDVSNVNTIGKPMTTEEDVTTTPPTKQQKLIKAGLLLGLVLVIAYVVLDYTVSQLLPRSRNRSEQLSTRTLGHLVYM